MMSRFTHLLLACLLTVLTSSFATAALPIVTTDAHEVAILTERVTLDGAQFSVDQFLQLTPKSIRESTGERLGFKKAIALRAAQRAVRKQLRQANKLSDRPSRGDKNQLSALLLALLLGGLGVHSFYMGKTVKGIAQLVLWLSGFLLCIPWLALSAWTLYDVITIATGSQEPKHGVWDPKL